MATDRAMRWAFSGCALLEFPGCGAAPGGGSDAGTTQGATTSGPGSAGPTTQGLDGDSGTSGGPEPTGGAAGSTGTGDEVSTGGPTSGTTTSAETVGETTLGETTLGEATRGETTRDETTRGETTTGETTRGETSESAGETGEPVCSPVLMKPSRCAVQPGSIDCPHEITSVMGRQVHWQVPLGAAPAAGWPVVLMFQGTGFGPDLTWSGGEALPYGGFQQIRLQALLLDHGFAVIAPAANVAWSTNFPNYEGSADHALMLALLAALAGDQIFGEIDESRMYATGISSGGYMTSRMAVSYAGSFAALAIRSASYATCAGAICAVPKLPADHPPTLLLHGAKDNTVPVSTAQLYADALQAAGVEHAMTVDPQAGHEWLKVAPEEVTCWFLQH